MTAQDIKAASAGVYPLSVIQGATSGEAGAARFVSENDAAAAVTVRGPGALLDLRNTSNASVFSVSQAGAPTMAAPAVTGDLTVTAGNVVVGTAGKGLTVKEGSNARMGTLTLTGATPVVVSTTAVTASSRIFMTTQSANGGTPTFCYVSTRSVGVSFTVQGVALDTSIVAWMIVEPA